MDDQLMMRWRRGRLFLSLFVHKNLEPFLHYNHKLELCKDFVYFLSSESDLLESVAVLVEVGANGPFMLAMKGKV